METRAVEVGDCSLGLIIGNPRWSSGGDKGWREGQTGGTRPYSMRLATGVDRGARAGLVSRQRELAAATTG